MTAAGPWAWLMGLPLGQGLAVLYGLCEDWLWRRDLLELLGSEQRDRLDSILEASVAPAGRPGSRTERAAQVAAFVAELGGEVSGG